MSVMAILQNSPGFIIVLLKGNGTFFWTRMSYLAAAYYYDPNSIVNLSLQFYVGKNKTKGWLLLSVKYYVFLFTYVLSIKFHSSCSLFAIFTSYKICFCIGTAKSYISVRFSRSVRSIFIWWSLFSCKSSDTAFRH